MGVSGVLFDFGLVLDGPLDSSSIKTILAIGMDTEKGASDAPQDHC